VGYWVVIYNRGTGAYHILIDWEAVLGFGFYKLKTKVGEVI